VANSSRACAIFPGSSVTETTFPPEVLAAARTGEGTYELDADAVEAARVPDDGVEAVESSIGIGEVSGYSITPIPGVDIVVSCPDGMMAHFTNFGPRTLRPNLGDTGDATYR